MRGARRIMNRPSMRSSRSPLQLAGGCERLRRTIPNNCPDGEYFRQIFWSSGIDLPDNLDHVIEEITLETMELPPGDKALLSLQLPAEFVILLDPVTHTSQFIDVKGEPTRERQSLSLVFDKLRAPVQRIELHPGPLRLSLENRTDMRVLPGLWLANNQLRSCCTGAARF